MAHMSWLSSKFDNDATGINNMRHKGWTNLLIIGMGKNFPERSYLNWIFLGTSKISQDGKFLGWRRTGRNARRGKVCTGSVTGSYGDDCQRG